MTASPRNPFESIGRAMVAAVVVLVGLSAIGSWDVWWHIETGRLAAQRLSTLPIDEFSLTRAGQPWVYKDLGADVLLWGAYALAGVWGLVVYKLLAAIGLGLCMALLAGHRTKASALVLLLAGSAFIVASFRIIARPEAASLVLLAVTLLLVDRREPRRGAEGRPGWRTPAALAGVHLIWANLHRGFVVGLAVVWTRAIYDLARCLWPGSRHQTAGDRWRPAFVGGLCALAATAASLVNPFGWTPLRLAFEVYGSSEMAVSVTEWATLGPGELVRSFPLAAVWAGSVAVLVPWGLARSVRRGGSVSHWDLLQAALFLALGLSAVRMLPLMAIGTVGPLAGALSELLRGRWLASRPAPAVAGLVVALLGWFDPRVAVTWPGLARDRYPEAAVEMIRTAPVVGEGFPTFTFAGYVIFRLWPDKHVLCDGRFDTVYDWDTMRDCLRAERTPEVLAAYRERFDLQWVLTHNRPGTRSFAYLDGESDWSLVYWDSASLLYVWRDGPNRPLAEALAYRLLRPHEPDVTLFRALDMTRGDPARRAQLDRELRRLQDAAPDDYRTHILLALYLYEIGAAETEEFRLIRNMLELERSTDPDAIDQVLEWVGRGR